MDSLQLHRISGWTPPPEEDLDAAPQPVKVDRKGIKIACCAIALIVLIGLAGAVGS